MIYLRFINFVKYILIIYIKKKQISYFLLLKNKVEQCIL